MRPTTYARYEQNARRHIIPSLGRLKLKNLAPAHVRSLYREKLDAGLSGRTVQYVHVTLHKALKQAAADGLVPRNAAANVRAPRPQKKEILPLMPEQDAASCSNRHGGTASRRCTSWPCTAGLEPPSIGLMAVGKGDAPSGSGSILLG